MFQKNPLEATFRELGVSYDSYALGNDYHEKRRYSSQTEELFPEVSDLMHYKAIFWVVAHQDFRNPNEIEKFEKYAEHGGRLFVFLQETNIGHNNEGKDALKGLLGADKLSLGDVSSFFPAHHPYVAGLKSLEFELPLREVVHFQFDEKSSIQEVLSSSYGNVVYMRNFPRIFISGLNFDRKIPVNFTQRMFSRIFEALDAVEGEKCSNGEDDNNNGVIDCQDYSCFDSSSCASCIAEGVFEGECSLSQPLLCRKGKIVND